MDFGFGTQNNVSTFLVQIEQVEVVESNIVMEIQNKATFQKLYTNVEDQDIICRRSSTYMSLTDSCVQFMNSLLSWRF